MFKKLYAVLFLSIALLMVACGGKEKNDKKDDGKVDFKEFSDFFSDAKLPFVYSDSLFPKKENDSILIAPEIYHQFIPDSIVLRSFGQTAKPKFYPVAKLLNGNEETYLLSRGIAGDKKILFINAFDKTSKFIASLPILKIDKNNVGKHTLTIDPNFNINRTVVRPIGDGNTISGQDVYVLNAGAGQFTLVMTDSLGDAVSELINPIDTLPRKHKFSADYGNGKSNLISIRDGLKPGRLSFFVYIGDVAKDCNGELKGELMFTNNDTAEYRQGGDPCVIRFIFTKNNVTLTEVEGCGSRLGNLQCSFNGVYPRKKPVKKVVEKSVKENERPAKKK